MSGGEPSRDQPEFTWSLDGGRLEPSPAGGAAAPPWAGGRVGGYELLGELGRGGMGVVYKARQPGLNRVVALKMIPARALADPDAVARFRREAEAVARLQHPNIVNVHEVGENDGQPYLVMEYVAGVSLARRLAGAPLAARVAARLIETLARAMDYAHRHGVIHRDLKPGNVLLPPAPEAETTDPTLVTGASSDVSGRGPADDLGLTTPKIVDFGLAKVPAGGEAPTMTGALLGTPNYMAPEQARGDAKRVGPPADVWALGVMLYECLTGRPPFQGETALDTLGLIVEREPVPPSSLNPRVPRDLETICLKCLEKGIDRRYAAAADLADDLGRFQRNEPVRARPPSAVDRARKFARRHTGLLAAVGAVFLALVIGLIGTGVGMVRARRAEQDARRLLAESYAQSAKLAVWHGAWREALGHLDRALQAGHPDEAGLRLQKVKAWCAVHDVPKAAAEVEALAARPDLGDLAGPVLLWQADLAIGRGDDEDAALARVRRAVAAGLPPAEREYAAGLLAATSPEAVRHFEWAVEADAFHQRANGMLALTLLMSGKSRAARERIAVARLLFPEDPTFAVLLAVAHAGDGDMPAAHSALESVRGKLGERPLQAARALVDLMQQMRDVSGVLNDNPTASLTAALARLMLSAANAAAEVRALRDGAGEGLLLPIPPVLANAFRRPLAAFSHALLGGRDRALAELREAYRVHPDAFLAVFRGLIAFEADNWPEAEEAFQAGCDGTSIIPLGRFARFATVFCAWERAGREPAARKEHLDRAVSNARKLLAFGRLPPTHAALVVSVATEADDLHLARWVMADWERQSPRDVLLWQKRFAVEYKAKAYGPAIAAADKILDLKPNDANALKNRQTAVEQLKRQANESR